MLAKEKLEEVKKVFDDYYRLRTDLTFKVLDFEEKEKDEHGREISTSTRKRYEVRRGAINPVFITYDKERADTLSSNLNHCLENVLNLEETIAWKKWEEVRNE